MGDPCPRILKCPISLVITDGSLRNFRELFSHITNKELARKMSKYVTPPGGVLPPHIYKCLISLAFMNGSLRNCQEMVSKLGDDYFPLQIRPVGTETPVRVQVPLRGLSPI